MAAVTGLGIKIHHPSLKVEIHNFGQPRVGNQALSKFMTQKLDGIFRVVHNKDMVPHLPPDLPEFNYHHTPY
jgi:predicted lipase